MAPHLIDTHAHLDYPHLYDQLDDVLQRADAAGVKQIISIGVKLSTSDKPKAIAEAHDHIWCSVGIHPHEAANEPLSCDVEAITKAAMHPKVVAIGEAGLDYFYDNAPRDRQAESLRAQITVARALDLPIIIHARDADEDMADVERAMKAKQHAASTAALPLAPHLRISSLSSRALMTRLQTLKMMISNH